MSNNDREETLPAIDDKPQETTPSEQDEPSFLPHRIFLNQVDSFHAKYIASVSGLIKHFKFPQQLFSVRY